MASYQFAPLPSNASVASLVTLVVCAWFAVAAGAMLTEPPVEKAFHSVTVQARTVYAMPDASVRIEVVAKRPTLRVS